MSRVDEDLLSRIAVQDSAAFAELYDRYAPRLLGLLAGMLRTRSEAEDVLQEVFWQVWNRARQYDPRRASPVVWLVMIARSRARDCLRSRPRDAAAIMTNTLPAMTSDAAMEAERGEETQLAHDALAQLPEEQRTAIVLAFFGGLTHEEISAQQSLPLGTVKTRIRRGMIRLREIIDSHKAVAS